MRGAYSGLFLWSTCLMWCRHCQQDVPAAREVAGPAACSRCQRAFRATPDGAQSGLKLAAVADCGVALEEFDRALPQPTLLAVTNAVSATNAFVLNGAFMAAPLSGIDQPTRAGRIGCGDALASVARLRCSAARCERNVLFDT